MKALLYQDFIESFKKYLFSFIIIVFIFILYMGYFLPNMKIETQNVTRFNNSLSISINTKSSASAINKKTINKKEFVEKNSLKKVVQEQNKSDVKSSATSNTGQQDNTIVSKISKNDYLQKGRVNYSRRAINNGFEGIVVFNVTVSSNAEIIKIDMVSSSGYNELDINALKSIKKWKFKPFDDAKQKIFQVPIEFKLE